jgi:serine protease Do
MSDKKSFSKKSVFVIGILMGVSLFCLALAANDRAFWKEAGPEPNVTFNAPPSFAPIADKVNPAVVTVYTTFKAKSPFQFGPNEFFFGNPGPQKGMGSGFIITSDGYILTNYHVVGDADEIKVAMGQKDKEKFTAKKIGWDQKIDIALLKIEAQNLPTVVLGDSDKVKVGDWVVAIGSPFQFTHTLTAGIVSAKGRRLGGPYDDFIQTDASINPGNSGGPLLNMRGEVVGINSIIISPGFSPGNVGIGFSVPINLIKSQLPQIKEKGKAVWAWLGIYFQELTPELAESFGLKAVKGALISKVAKNSPAEKAGLKDGDIILEFDGKQVDDSGQLPSMVSSREPGDKVQVKIFRAGKAMELTVVLGTMPDEKEMAAAAAEVKGGNQLGLAVSDLTNEHAEELGFQALKGVLVVSVSPESQLNGVLIPDDLILQINLRDVPTTKDFEAIVAKLKPGQTVNVKYRRGPGTVFYAFKLEAKNKK